MKKEYLSALTNKQIFDKGDQIYLKKRIFITFQNLIKTFFNQDIKSFKKILDLGAGDKTFSRVVKENGIDSVGLDIQDIDLENQKINFENEHFDLVTGISLIEHIFNPTNFLTESFRVLKKDGFLILVTPDWEYNFKNFYNDPTHIRPYTQKSLKFLLKSFGYHEIKIVPWLVCKPPWLWKVPLSFFIARNLPFRHNNNKFIPDFLKGKSKTLLVICRKSSSDIKK